MILYVIISIIILILFLFFMRDVLIKIMNKRRNSKCKTRPVTYEKPVSTLDGETLPASCPNLDDYVHRSELVPEYTFRINPYYVKQIEKIDKTVYKNGTCNCDEKPNMYEYDWIPVLDSECRVE